MNVLLFLLAVLGVSYSTFSLVRFRLIEGRVPLSVIVANVAFNVLYVLGLSYQALNAITATRFNVAYANFYYNDALILKASWTILQYAVAMELYNIAMMFVYRTRKLDNRIEPFRIPDWAFGACFMFTVGMILILLYRIISTVGFAYFIEFNILRSVFFQGLGIVLELLFVAIFLSAVFSVIEVGRRRRWIFVFVLGSLITVARWPLILLGLTYGSYLYYLRGKRILQAKYIIYTFTFVVLAIAFVLLTRPNTDTWEGPLQAIYGTEQAPQAPALMLGLENETMQATLAAHRFSFLGEMIPKQFKAPFGIGEQTTGNEAFTKMYWNTRLRYDQSEISFGGLNELYFRGGLLMIAALLLFVPVGYIIVLNRIRRRTSMFIFEVAVCWFFFQLMRSDLAHTFSRIPSLVLGAVVAILIVNAAQDSMRSLARRTNARDGTLQPSQP